MSDSWKPRVRFAPSPTGLFHVGSYRTALFNYLFAKQKGGAFVLRIEDTDKARSKPEFEQNILDSLNWLGLKHDEFYRQSERTVIYTKYLRQLIDSGHARLDGELVRFKNPNRVVSFTDLIRGEISFDTTELGDFIIAKSLTEPVFHLVNVVDDFEMKISHVIRGEDHVSNTPRHTLLQEALGAPRPIYAHIPLILAPDRSKLSKRHGALPVTEYREQGYLPEALVNYLAFLGWNPGGDQELYELPELIKAFHLEKIQKGGAIFNQDKLNWYNREYLKRLSDAKFANRAKAFWPEAPTGLLEKLAPELKNRLTTLGEIKAMVTAGEFDYYQNTPKPDKAILKTPEFLPELIKKLETIPEEEFSAEEIKNRLWDYATKEGRAKILWPMRVALTGKERSPDPFSVAAILGKKETLERLAYAASL